MAKKRMHVDRTLAKKIQVVERLKRGEKVKNLAAEFDIPKSTISTWKKQGDTYAQQADKGIQMKRKRNRNAKIVEVSEALLMWFMEMRDHPQAPTLSNAMLLSKATE